MPKQRQSKGKGRGKSKRPSFTDGIVHVRATFNNTIVTITDKQGNTVSSCSAGELGYKGARKSTPLAGQKAAVEAAMKAKVYGLRDVDVRFSGPGACREYVVKALQGQGVEFNVRSLSDVTPIPHNGCRPPKKRRV